MSTQFPPVENIPQDLLDAGFDAWDLLYQFYYRVNEQMDKHQIKRADIATKLGKSRSAISQLLNNNPNITLLKMAELANAVGLELSFFYKDTLQDTNSQGERTSINPKEPSHA